MNLRTLSTSHQERLVSLLRSVSAMTLRVQQNLDRKTAWRKKDHSFVTVADLAGQILILRTLAEMVPGERVWAEEEATSLKNTRRLGRVRELVEDVLDKSVSEGELIELISYRGGEETERTWLLDPIDGTKGFVRTGHYASTLATLEQDRVSRAWLAVPGDKEKSPGVSGYLFTAEHEAGAKRIDLLNGDVKHLEAPADLPLDGGVVRIAATRANHIDLPPTVDPDKWHAEPYAIDSIAKYAALAVGVAHIYPRKPSRWTGPFYCWDHAAGALILKETGGVTTDLAGKPLDWSAGVRLTNNRGIFAAAHPSIHEQLQPLFADHVRDIL